MPAWVCGSQWVDFHWKLQGWGLTILACVSFYPGLFHYQEYLFFLLLFIAVGVAIFQGRSCWIRNPIDWPLALLVGWILITIPFSIDPAYSFAEWRKLVAHIVVFYWALLVLKNCAGTDTWKSVLRAVLVGASTMSLSSMVGFIQAGGTLVNRDIRAVVPPSFSSVWLGTPSLSSVGIWMAASIVMALPFVMAYAVRAKHRGEKLVAGGALCLMLLAGFFAYSRGAWLAMAVMGLGLGFLRGSRKTVVLGILVIMAFFGVALGVSRLGYLEGIFNSSSAITRLECWSLGVQAWLNSPIVGVGFGMNIFEQLYLMMGQPDGCGVGHHLHNTFLMYAMGSGVPALLCVLWMFVAIVRTLSRNAGDGGRDEVASFKLAGALMVLGYGVAMSFDLLFVGNLAHLFWMLVAVGMALAGPEAMPAHCRRG